MREHHGAGRDRWEREREAFLRLARVFSQETRGGLLGEAFEVLLEALTLEGGAAFSVDGTFVELVCRAWPVRQVSERPLAEDDPFLPSLLELTGRTAAARKIVHLPDLARAELPAPLRDRLARARLPLARALPVQHQREVLGVITLVARDSATFDAGALAFCETATHLVAIAVRA